MIIKQETHKIDYLVADDDYVKVTKTPYEVELQELKFRNGHGTIRKLNKYAYQVISTGKIGFYATKSDKRVDNFISLRRTIQKNRKRIAANFLGEKNEFMFTLTYADKVYDLDTLNADINAFRMRLTRWANQNNMGELKFVFAREPHADSSWHVHMLIKFMDQKKVYIPNKFKYQRQTKKHKKRTFEQIKKDKIDAPIFDLWGHGVVRVQWLHGISSVANYLATYLTNVLVDELDEKEVKKLEKQGKKITQTVSDESKSVVKFLRLKYFPANARIFSWSQNFVEPEIFMMKYGEARKEFHLMPEHMNYRSAVEVEIEHDNFDKPFVQRVVVEGYNLNVKVEHNVHIAKRDWASWRHEIEKAIKSNFSDFKRHAQTYLGEEARHFVKFYYYNKLSEFDRNNKKEDYFAWRAFKTLAEEKRYEQMRKFYADTFGIVVKSFKEMITPQKYEKLTLVSS